MAKNTQLPKYRVNADPPGMQVPGYGLVDHGTELTVRDPAFVPRACMSPLNAAAEAAFKRRREAVAEETRAKLKAGVDPRTDEPLAEPLTNDQTERLVKAQVAKVGPGKVRGQAVTPKRPTVAPGTFSVAPATIAKADPDDIDETTGAPVAPQGQRASDAE